MPRHGIALICALGLSCAGIQVAEAQAVWTGLGGDAVWSDSANWESGLVPVSGGAVTFGSSASGLSTLDSSITLSTLTFKGLAGSLTLDNASGAALTLQSGGAVAIASGQNVSIGVPIGGAGGVLLNGDGTGTALLSGINTYSGKTLANDGTLLAGSPSAFGGAGGLSAVALAGNGTLDLNGFSNTIGSLASPSAASRVLLTGGATLTIAGAGTQPMSFAGTISGSGSLAIAAQNLSLVSPSGNTYSGGTLISGGILQAENTSGSATGTGPVTIGPQGGLTLGGDNASGSVAAGTIGDNGTLTIDRSDPSFTLPNSIAGTGSVTQSGSGAVTLGGTNTYSGGTTVTAGTLVAGSAAAFGSGGPLVIKSASLDLAGFNAAFGDITADAASSIVLGAGTLTDDGGGASAIGATISGTGGFTEAGPGTVFLSGSNSYTGPTTIGGGTVVVENSRALGNSTVTLTGGAGLVVESGFAVGNALAFTGSSNVLSGGGSVSSPITADGALVVAPGDSLGNGPGTLTFTGNLTLASGGSILFRLFDATGTAGTGYGLINAAGGLDLTAAPGTLSFDLVSVSGTGVPASAINFHPDTAYSWEFATSTSVAGFNPDQFHLITTGFLNGTSGGAFFFSETGDSLFLNFTPVPEPSTWILVGAGVLALVPFLVWRRRAHAGPLPQAPVRGRSEQ